MPFIITIHDDGMNNYYGGSTYTYQNQRYPSIVNKSEAKRYKSRGIAERSAEALRRKCDGKYYVDEVSD